MGPLNGRPVRRGPGRVMRGLLLGAVLAAGGDLSAQAPPAGTVLGRVLDQETQAPQVGAFVSLLDEEGVRRAGVLTDATGRYILRAPAPGRYRLRAERIGVESRFSPWFQVTPGQVVSQDILTRPAAVTLAGVEVTGESRCDLRGASGSATVALWEEARKALEVAEWVDAAGYIYDTRTWERILAPDGRRVLQETSTLGTQVGKGAFRSVDTELLLARGFIQDEGNGQVYYAPDAAVLLSDAFLSTHCFRAVREGGRLGLAFEPEPGRTVSDIEGTLWFAGGGLLDRLEYSYTALPPEVRGSPLLGGEIHFHRLEEGAWIVREWRIRMPRLTAVLGLSGQSSRTEVTAIHEAGGEVRRARRAARIEAVMDERRGAVRGRVAQGGAGEPLAGAEVFLSGTEYAVTAARDGSFLLEAVRPGVYDLVVSHPVLDSLGEVFPGVPVEVLADSLSVAELRLPGRSDLLRQRCDGVPLLALDEPDFRADGEPSVVGGVFLDAAGRPVPGWPVRVRWIRPSLEGGRVVREEWRGTVVFTGPRGGWAVCGLPADVHITAEPAREAMDRNAASAGRGRWGEGTPVGILGPGATAWVEFRGAGR